MPRMNGWEFLEEYEKLDTAKKEKNIIIILTTSMNPEDREKANHITSVSEFHSKPLTPEILINILERYSSDDYYSKGSLGEVINVAVSSTGKLTATFSNIKVEGFVGNDIQTVSGTVIEN